MRTLSRPMFNMGGPIKQGIMNGIREPYAGGSKAALVGNPVYPKTGGREHHGWNLLVQGGMRVAPRIAPRVMPHIKRAGSAFKNIFRGTPTVSGGIGKHSYEATRMAPLSKLEKIKSWFGTAPAGKYLATSPEGKFLSGAPGKLGWVGGKIGSTLKGAARSPLTVGAGAYYGVPWGYKKLFGKDEVAPPGGFLKSGAAGGASLADLVAPGDGKGTKLKALTDAQKEKWADAQRGKRLNNLLDIMGYERSKKTAIADALIDASKIVGERGTLDPKNITKELINPIIQATSARLDKPGQIREAVGLMMAKGEIEKDLYKWKPGTALKNAQDMADTLGIPLEEAMKRQSGMAINVAQDLQALQILKKGVPLTAAEIEQRTRMFANDNKEEFREVITAEQLKGKEDVDPVKIVQGLLTGDPAKDDGFYQVDKEVIKVTNGVPKKQW